MATSSGTLSEEPEFWISDNKPMDLSYRGAKLSMTVKRSSDPAPRDYARIWLYHWVAELARFAPAAHQQLVGTVIQHWNGSRSVDFNGLQLWAEGQFRIRVDIMRYNGGTGQDIIIQTLFSEDIHREIPCVDTVTYHFYDEEDNEVPKNK
ncbi:hypothetical protein F5Y05DRAFT_415634 [Hypoxylon sp. FL0543]|nr:hypothetical protein F5Y05DRAFT_415634 [Hypoxylon sp. FL0543]